MLRIALIFFSELFRCHFVCLNRWTASTIWAKCISV